MCNREAMFISVLLLIAISVCPSLAALPQFSWDTLPVFFHSANTSGQYSVEALKTIAKFQMATFGKWMGSDVPSIDDEDEMVMAMKAVKQVNPKISTYFYMNSYQDTPLMTRMHREAQQHPDYYLRVDNGTLVRAPNGAYAFDLSKLEVRQWWQDTCLNATKLANGGGCFCDSSQAPYVDFNPYLSEAKQEAWAHGMLNMTRDVQKALGNDNLLIGKVAAQPNVKAVQIELSRPLNFSIDELLLGEFAHQVIQAHVPISVPCSSDLTDFIAAFLIGAGQYSYFGCGHWNSTGSDASPFTWHPEYDKPLGAPKGPAEFSSSGMWSRAFALGTNVTFDATADKGTIYWST